MTEPKSDETLQDPIHAVLLKFEDMIAQDLPIGLPSMNKGHKFKIELEDVMPLACQPLQDEPA